MLPVIVIAGTHSYSGWLSCDMSGTRLANWQDSLAAHPPSRLALCPRLGCLEMESEEVSIGKPDELKPLCWMCGKPADPTCAAKLVLGAPSCWHLDGLGYQVQRGKRRDRVRIEMPRCARCRNWASDWIVLLIVATATAAMVGTLVQSLAYPNVMPPSWIKVYHHGVGNTGTGIGLVFGFVAALLGMTWARKRSGRRSANTYPPVVSLRDLGWSFLSE